MKKKSTWGPLKPGEKVIIYGDPPDTYRKESKKKASNIKKPVVKRA